MKNIIAIILFTLALLFVGNTSAQNSWVQFTVQYDFYAPQESNFMFVSNANGDTLLYHAPTTTYETLDTVINCDAGDYIITLSDSYGDGWLSNQPASFKMHNLCQGMILNFDPLTQQFFTLDTLVNILPCAPPVAGCMDTNATNYDPLATVSDGSCLYPPCGGFLQSNVYQLCWGSQAGLVFEWWSSPNVNCDVTQLHYGDANGYTYSWGGLWPASNGYNNFAAAAGNGQMPPNWNVEHYMVLEYIDGTFSDTMYYTPNSCIEGCTDSTQQSYNPWATIDNGSCAGTTCDTATQYQITMEITLDNWPGETSWIMNSAGVIGEATQGTYTFNDIGQTFTYNFCVQQGAGFELILNDSFGDGMAGSTSGGTIDGYVVIFDCNGDTIWELTNPAFGNVTYSGPQQGLPCATTPDILGCTDNNYQEYNPLANIDDGSCANLHIYGCVDSTMFNYNSSATIMDLVPDCNYTLTIEDDAGDGWGNSYLGVVQGTNNWTFTMGPGPYSQSFPLILDSDKPVKIYYFEVGGPQTPPEEVQFQTWHNSFNLVNSLGDTLLAEGTNPFANNGQGALQGFDAPFWITYSATPYCGDYCIPKVFGCMDSTALNYNPNANTTDTCIAIVYGCTNNLAVNFNPSANIDDGSCIPYVFGCMDSTAWNYNFFANIDDGSCIYFGCTDSTALNYDSTANTDNGTCVYPTLGCTDASMFNYDPAANVDDGSCIPYIYGCTDPTAFNYDSLANTENESCLPVVFGCIDSTALNFDPLANTDNGTCDLPVLGCTDFYAYNYNIQANIEDGSCLYDAGCITGPGDPYWLNDQCYAWVIQVDPYCCETEWDNICQLTYDYCYNGWTGNLPPARLEGEQIIVYPNPTHDKIYVNENVDLKIFNSLGDIIVSGNNINVLDVSKINPGMYIIHIIYNNKIYIKNIIKK